MYEYRTILSILLLLFLYTQTSAQSDTVNVDCYTKFSSKKNPSISNHYELIVQLDLLDSIITICKKEDPDWISTVIDGGMSIKDSLFYHPFVWNYYLYLYRAERYEDGIIYANGLIDYAEETGYHLSGDFYIETGLNHQYKSNFAQEINMYHKAEEAYKRDEDINLVYALSCIGSFYTEIADYPQAIDYTNKAYEEAQNLEKDFQKYYVSSNQLLGLAKIYAKKDDYNTSIEYLNRALEDVKKQNNADLIITLYADYIQILMDAKKVDEALMLLEESDPYFKGEAQAQLKSEYLRYYQLKRSKLGQLTNKSGLLTHPDTLLKAVHKNDGKKEIFEYGVNYFIGKNDFNKALEFSSMEIDLLKNESKDQKKSASDLIIEKQKSNTLARENYALKESERTKETSLLLLSLLLFTSIFSLIVVWRWNTKTKKYNKEIEAKSKKISEYSEELQQITYVMTHDLKEPAKTINSFANLVQKDYSSSIPDSLKPIFDIIFKTSNGMLDTLSNFHSYLLLGEKTQLELTDLNDLLNKAKTNLAGHINNSEAKITSTLLPSLTVYPEEILKLFQSLLSNSIKYAKKDTSVIINIDCKESGQMIQFSFKDNGIGVPLKSQKEIFSLFNRLHTKEEIEGSGIGLANCKKIVELHEGEIWLESIEGNGCTFFFTLSDLSKQAHS